MGNGGFITTYEEYSKEVLAYRELAREYIDRLNECLAQRTSESIARYMEIAGEEELTAHCLTAMSLIYDAYIISMITREEINRRGAAYFICNGSSVEELSRLIKLLEFRIWELEFEGGKEAECHMQEVLESYNITPQAVSVIVAVAGKDKRATYLRLASSYLSQHRKDDTLAVLTFAADMYPKDEGFRDMICDIQKIDF